MIVIGIDISLNRTGYAAIKDDGTVLTSGIIKSKPVGDKPVNEVRRIVKIAEDMIEKIDDLLPNQNPNLIIIEGMAFAVRNTTALVQLAALNYLVRILLDQFKWPFVIVAPPSLKKFITQKGNSDKNVMMMCVLRDYGHEFLDDNICDAFSLAACGLALLGNPLKELTKPQKEVINLLKFQL